MAQLNLYVPDEVAARPRREADLQGQSLSKYVAEKYLKIQTGRMAIDAEFLAGLDALGPMPEDFVAPPRETDHQEPDWSFDDLSA